MRFILWLKCEIVVKRKEIDPAGSISFLYCSCVSDYMFIPPSTWIT